MKRVIICFLIIVILLSLVGCGNTSDLIQNVIDNNNPEPTASETVIEDVTYYKEAAQKLIAAGDYNGAAQVLQEGISKTGAWELVSMLNDIANLVSQDPTEDSSSLPEQTEPPTTVAPTEPAETNPPVTVKLSDVQRRINVFLSNFSETYFYKYPCDQYSLIDFSRAHALLNQDGTIHYSGYECYMSEEDVNSILNKYFGIVYPENGSSNVISGGYNDTIRYDGSSYYFAAAAGEFYGYVSVANQMSLNSDGTYTVYFDVYSLTDMWDDDAANYYSYTSNQAQKSGALTYCYSGTAVVKDYVRTNGVESYQLIRLSTDR